MLTYAYIYCDAEDNPISIFRIDYGLFYIKYNRALPVLFLCIIARCKIQIRDFFIGET